MFKRKLEYSVISSSFLEMEGASDFTMRLSDIITDSDDDHGWGVREPKLMN